MSDWICPKCGTTHIKEREISKRSRLFSNVFLYGIHIVCAFFLGPFLRMLGSISGTLGSIAVLSGIVYYYVELPVIAEFQKSGKIVAVTLKNHKHHHLHSEMKNHKHSDRYGIVPSQVFSQDPAIEYINEHFTTYGNLVEETDSFEEWSDVIKKEYLDKYDSPISAEGDKLIRKKLGGYGVFPAR